ncbi:MAG: alpha/beta fold hydrolase [Acidobacteriota bacterium]|nr:alpha/beta fold hydrolase [Acidobacteriota bacterium]
MRISTARIAKLVSFIVAVVLFAVVSISTISGFLVYQIIHPARTPSSFDLSIMMGHPTTFSFPVADGPKREGWFFPGLQGAPTIMVCHGYQSQRADVLTLVTTLQDHQYNVFLFDFSGHGTSAGSSTLGYKEAGEVESAIQALGTRSDVDQKRFGLWGTDMGGYAVLETAERDPRVGAFAVTDVYRSPREMLHMQVRQSGLTAVPYVLNASDAIFRLINYLYRSTPLVSADIGRTHGVPKLFIISDDQPQLASETTELYNEAPDPKQLLRDAVRYRDMSDDDRKNYENAIVSFFLQYLPPVQ